ncbi:SwmB domain-containing protein, partial [Chromatium okenii]|uniref:SwmB domain-containing protein n=1 Tax=Chromatium okenii TaxID=61644 RepID=UPI0026EF725E
NALASIGDPLAVTVTNDSIVPTVQSVSSTEDAKTYKVGVVIPITVKFSESVFVTGTPLLALETGNLDRTATFDKISESDNKTLIFNYTVQSGDNSADLAYTTSNALSLNSGTIKDAAGNVATLTLPEPSALNSLKVNKNLVIDGIVPTIISSVGYTGSKNIILNTTETVNGSSISANDFAVVMNSSQTSVTGVAVSGTSVTLTLADNIPNSATLSIKYTQSTNKITDTAGNALASIGDPLAVTVTNDS